MNITRFDISKKALKHIPLLEGEERLEILHLGYNYISKIENIVSLPLLRILDLSNNQIEKLENLNKIKQLSELILRSNKLNKIENLEYCTNLEKLDISFNFITKIEGLGTLNKLKYFYASSNSISDISNIVHISSLEEADFATNKIELLPAFRNDKLKILNISENHIILIDQLNSVNNLQLLQHLCISNNPVENDPLFKSYVANAKYVIETSHTRKLSSKYLLEKHEAPIASCEPVMNMVPQEEKITAEDANINKIKAIRDEFIDKKQLLPSIGISQVVGESLEIYGDALMSLEDGSNYDKISQISFECIDFKYIIKRKIINLLLKFTTLNKLVFTYNNIDSFLYLTKLEELKNVVCLDIINNAVTNCVLFRHFIAYRFPHIKWLNDKEVTVSENVVSKNDFKKFDSLLKPKENTIKVNSDEISVYTSKLLNSAIEKYNITEDITEQIPTVMAKTIKSIVKEIRLV